MDGQKYEMMVWSLQGEAQDAPGAFRTKVLLISLSAYLVLFVMLTSLMASLMFMWKVSHVGLYFKYILVSLFFVIVPIVWLTLRMLFLNWPPPEGRELQEEEAPRLFALLDELRQHVQGAPVHQVLVTDEFNAGVVQRPRFGLFGGYRNYLIIGLPMLYALTAEEFKAVIAHEYGHLAGGHGKLGRWIGRQRVTFAELQTHARERRESNWMNNLIATAIDWFAPYYNAYTFVLSRQHEYEADAVAASAAGPQAISSALTRMDMLDPWLRDRFWKKIYQQASQHATPQFMPFAAMRKLLAVTMDEWATKERLGEVWKDESDVFDTHPCLRERVTAVEQRPAIPCAVKASAAEELLGKFAQTLARELDEQWWAGEKTKWQSYHGRYARSMARIAELEQRPLETLSTVDAQELGLLLAEFRTLADAKRVLQMLVKRPGERFPKPLYYYGQVLLSENNIRGLDYLEEACQLAPSMLDDCARVGCDWLYRNRGIAEGHQWFYKLVAAAGR